MPILTPENEVLIRNMGPEEFLHYADLEADGFIPTMCVHTAQATLQAELKLNEKLDAVYENLEAKADEVVGLEIDLSAAEDHAETLKNNIRDLVAESGDGPVDKDRLLLEVAA